MRMDFSSEQNWDAIAHSTAGWKGEPEVEDWGGQKGDWISGEIKVVNGSDAWENG